MAQAKAGPRKTTRNVTLKLTEGEADFILGVCALVSGHPTRSPRKYGVRIANALEDALGYDFEDADASQLALGNIAFRNYDEEPVSEAELAFEFLRNLNDSHESISWVVPG